MTTELAIVIPTLNERENIRILIDRLTRVLAGVDWEVIFVDDNSTDGTLDELKSLSNANSHVRFLHRIDQRGLSSACLEGMGATASPFLAVMDADLQHDEALLPQMFRILRGGDTDLVVGSRYIPGGGVGSWSQGRRVTSRVATRISHLLLKVNLSDPMSGFFMIRREVYEDAIDSISGKGFKILIDLVASVNRPLRTKEIPFVFRPREHGESKLDTLVMWEYLILIADKLIGRVVPVRFVLFVLVGCLGACLHLIVLGVALNGFRLRFIFAQILATAIAMIVNYFINNLFTYHDQRLKGWRVVFGLVTFMSICAVGAVINVNAADFLYKATVPWWLAGLLGAGIGSVWNYAVSSVLVWRRKRAAA